MALPPPLTEVMTTSATPSPETDSRRAEIDALLTPRLKRIDKFREKQLKEKKRRIKLTFTAGWSAIAAALYIDFWLITHTFNSGSDDGVVGATLSVGLLFFIWIMQPGKKYKKHFKQTVFPIVLEAFDRSFSYAPQMKLDKKLFERSGIIRQGLHFANQEDHITGNYKGVEFTFFEGHFKTRGKNAHTVFKGGIFILKFPESFTGHTMLKKDKGSVGNFLESKIGKSQATGDKFEPVRLEDPDFEKLFEAYGTDQQEARYILTPALMERLKTVRLGSKPLPRFSCPVQAAFFEKYALLYLYCNENLMEPPSLKTTVRNTEFVTDLLFDLEEICSIIDELNLAYFAKRRGGAGKMNEQIEKNNRASQSAAPLKKS